MNREGHKIAAFVIMPNHLHALIYFVHANKSVNQYVGTGKRFMSYNIVDLLKKQNNIKLLDSLKLGVNDTKKNLRKIHQVFEASFDGKKCMSSAFTLQKLNYIHMNPMRGKWNLCNYPSEYKYSSALQYEKNITSDYPVTLLSAIDSFEFGIAKG